MPDPKETESKGFTVTDRRGEAKEEEAKRPEPQAPPKRPESKRPKSAPQRIDFATFLISMSTSAFVHMGLVEDPVTHERKKNLEMARQDIDLIEMLAEKTKGNLTPEESGMMEQILYELRIRFVEASR